MPPFPEEPLFNTEDHRAQDSVEDFSQAAAPEPAEAFAPESQSPLSLPENYLAHARRAAQAAAEPETDRGQRGKFRIPFPGEAELALAGDHAPKGSRRGSHPLAFAALILLLVASGYLITRSLVHESDVVALQLNRTAAPNGPSTPGSAAASKSAGTSGLVASANPVETLVEESVSAVYAVPPPASPGTAAPSQAAAPATLEQTAANLAPNAGATNCA